jgi:cell wall-associated NlpC family hydrolase
MIKVTKDALRDGIIAARRKIGTPYRLGADVKPGALAEARELDCSEITKRIYRDYYKVSDFPDLADNQFRYCQKFGIPIFYPLNSKVQPGDLVFLWAKDEDPPRIGHVMMVAGDLDPFCGPMLIEARGAPYRMVTITSLIDVMAWFKDRYAGIYRLLDVTPTL